MRTILEKIKAKNIKCAIFDFDGTISTLRYGWEKIMYEVFCEFIPGTENNPELCQKILDYIDESTGIQTAYQMMWLKEQVEILDPERPKKDIWEYKDIFNERLLAMVTKKIENGDFDSSEYLICGSRELLDYLKKEGIKCYVASGTDQADVEKECKILGMDGYFEKIAGAPYRKLDCSKDKVIHELIANNGYRPQEMVVFGDGKVEIALAREVGAYAVGVASDEEKRCGINEKKLRKLQIAGAEDIIGDYL